MKNVPVIIPSLNPDEKLNGVVTSLIEYGFDDIILVNDGSDEAHMEPFSELEKLPQCTLLKHDVNRGKGRALKTAFEYCIQNRDHIDGVVTVDGDGQHKASDIKKCAERMQELKDVLVLGARNFAGDDVPFKSRLGNNMTSFVFKFVCGMNINDTQTGLRAIPAEYLQLCCDIEGERFEYETNMLLEFKRHNIRYGEVTIETVYLEENASTHFNPLKDSMKIYGVIFKFMASSFSSSIVDLGMFAVIQWIALKFMEAQAAVFVATAGARIVSSLFNYTCNKKAVFQSKGDVKGSLIRYYILCVCQMMVSYALVWMVKDFLALGSTMTVVAKAFIDIVLFLISFQIQRRWVFK